MTTITTMTAPTPALAVVTVMLIVLVDASSLVHANSRCRLNNIPLQKDFHMSRFKGMWYSTYKLGAGDSALSLFTEIYDVRLSFTLNSKGGFDLKAAGSKFYGSWCPKGKGYAKIPAPETPEQMVMFFDTTIGRKVGEKPAWILKTDYKNYAIIYSCWKQTPAGTCEPASTYIGVLQRFTETLSDRLQTEVNQALKSACVDPTKLSKITHYGYCIGHDGL